MRGRAWNTGGVEARVGAGFALVLAILSLMLLTFLGLTMAPPRHRAPDRHQLPWSQQALYNAEAGSRWRASC